MNQTNIETVSKATLEKKKKRKKKREKKKIRREQTTSERQGAAPMDFPEPIDAILN